MRTLYCTFFCAFLSLNLLPAQVLQLNVLPIETDPNMDPNAARHRVFFNPSVTSLDKLFVMLPGTNGLPEMYDEITAVAANLGYHAISLSYPNYTGISDLCKFDPDPNCSENARMEIITGTDLHPTIEVTEDNCIINRLLKLLQYLHNQHPNIGWNQFYENDNLLWEKFAIGGHSQGGGHSALLAKNFLLNRVLFFNSPSDANQFGELPSWISTDHITPNSHYFAFFHWQNGGLNRLEVYDLFGILDNGPEENTDLLQAPYNHSHVLYTDHNTFNMTNFENLGDIDPHNDIIVDHELIIDSSGHSAFKAVWEYMLIEDVSTSTSALIEQSLEVQVFPNPSSGLVNLRSTNETGILVEIFDTKGQLIKQLPFSNFLNLSDLEKGLYVLKMTFEEGILVERLFIQN